MAESEPRDPEPLVLNLVFLGPPLLFAGLIVVLAGRSDAMTFNPLSVALVVAFTVVVIAFPLLRHGFRE